MKYPQMTFTALILISCTVCLIKLNSGEPSAEISPEQKKYSNYVAYALDYVQSQKGWEDTQNVEIVSLYYDHMILRKAFDSNILTRNLMRKACQTIGMINYKYTEAMKTFVDYMYIIIHKCQLFRNEYFTEYFIHCVSSLSEVIQNSKSMFDHLYEAMVFMRSLVQRYASFGYIKSIAIVDEIRFFKKYVKYTIDRNANLDSSIDLNTTPALQYSVEEFENIKQFYNDATTILSSIYERVHSYVINISQPQDLIAIYHAGDSNERDPNFVSNTCHKLNSYYEEAIEYLYKDFGFEELFNPSTPSLMPPRNHTLIYVEGIEALQIIIQETGWERLNHMDILIDSQSINIRDIVKEPITYLNFDTKRQHITRFVRCRYGEIFKNYNTLLSAIVNICRLDLSSYVDCMILFFEALWKSTTLLEKMKAAIITLNKTSIWIYYMKSPWTLRKLLEFTEYYLLELKNPMFLPENFIGKTTQQKAEMVAYLEGRFLHCHVGLDLELRNFIGRMNRTCRSKQPLFDMHSKEREFKNVMDQTENKGYLAIPRYACDYLNKFCEDAIKDSYEDLGFNIIDCLNGSFNESTFEKSLSD